MALDLSRIISGLETGPYLKLEQGHFHPYPFQIINYLATLIYEVRRNGRIFKQNTNEHN